MKRTMLVALCLVAVLSQGAAGENITIDDYLEMIRRGHPFFEKENLQIDIDTKGRDRFLGGQDWGLEVVPLATYKEPVDNSAFAPERVIAFDLEASAGRAFWGTGSRFSVAWQTSVSDQTFPSISIPTGGNPIEIPLGAETYYRHRLSATYSFPFLRNRRGELDRLEYELADFTVRLSTVQALENQEDFLLAQGSRFIDWALVAEEVRIAEARLRFSEEQRDQTNRRRRANLVDEVDVLRAQDAVQSSEEAFVFSSSRSKAKQAELAVLAQNPDLYGMQPDMDIYALVSLPPLDESLEALEDQRILKTLRILRDQLRRQQQALENVARPELSLNLTGALQKGDDRALDAFVIAEPDLGVALEFRYPLRNRTAKADVARSELEIRQVEKEIESVRLGLEADLRGIWIRLKELEKILALNKAQVDIARQKTQEEQRLYNQGRNELTFVIQSRDSEALAELSYALNAGAYQALLLEYRALLDQLLPGE